MTMGLEPAVLGAPGQQPSVALEGPACGRNPSVARESLSAALCRSFLGLTVCPGGCRGGAACGRGGGALRPLGGVAARPLAEPAFAQSLSCSRGGRARVLAARGAGLHGRTVG